ncbi:MAG: hypothetical protein V3W18_12115 [candidate division Zixibacteria bacterium]
MRNRIILSWIFILLLISSAAYSQSLDRAHRSYDPETVTVTRWLDPSTRPMTYEEYIQGKEFDDTQKVDLVYSSLIATDYYIDIIVNEDLYPLIEEALDTFMLDLQGEGYTINLYTANETLSPEGLREVFINDWLGQGLDGTILVGDLAVPWYEMDEPEGWGGAHVQFPCDLYFMDLNGFWDDSDEDGMFDAHSGRLEADIWVGRLYASSMSDYGANEVQLLRNYFQKNHNFRTGELLMDDKALAFVDNDWNMYGWGYDVAMAYPATDSVIDIFETSRGTYIDRLQEVSENRYEHVLICSHSSAFAHYLYYNHNNYQLFHNYEVESFMMQALTYNLFACSNARFVETDNMGGWYVFQSEYGLLSLGATKTGSMLCFDDYYAPLGEGATHGDAFLEWARINMETCAGADSRAWFYGMCLQGDPTIMLARFHNPVGGCEYVMGDFNGSGVFNIADIIVAFSKLKTGDPEPLLLCECPPGSGDEWAVAMDVNNTCGFNIADIITAFSNLKTGAPDFVPCEDCPPM